MLLYGVYVFAVTWTYGRLVRIVKSFYLPRPYLKLAAFRYEGIVREFPITHLQVSNKTAEKILSLHTHARPTPTEQFVFCETDQLCEPLMGPYPASTVAGWERTKLHATGDFWDQWISPSILVQAWRLQFLEWAQSLAGSLFGPIYGRHVATAKSKPRREFCLSANTVRVQPHHPKYLIQLWFISLPWLLPELTLAHVSLFSNSFQGPTSLTPLFHSRIW